MMLRRTFLIYVILSLSEYIKTEKPKVCDPNSYVIVGCNVCRCDDKGNINNDMCTKRSCEKTRVQIEESRRTYNVNGSCEPGTWYSTEPCQLCYCVLKNKLLCNSNNGRSKLLLGKFDFIVCGTNLLQEASELAAEGKDLRNRKKKRHRKIAKDIRKVRNKRTTTTTEGSNTDELYQDILHKGKLKNIQNIARISKNRDTSDYDDDDNSEKEIGITVLPYSDSDESEYDRKERSDERIIGNDFSHNTLADLRDNNNKEPKLAEFNVPHLLKKVLSLTMRKSMLSLDNKKQCTPGITYSSGCNKCFCLKNGKILCTNQLCL